MNNNLENLSFRETQKEKIENLLSHEEIALIIENIKAGKTLGEGNYGKVKVIPEKSNICMKESLLNSNDGNNPILEMTLQEEAKEMGVNVPTPRAIAYNQETVYFFMDTINGLSLEYIMNSENPLDVIPENFSYKDFAEKVQEEIKKLNKKIRHKDIKPGNIMINKEGKPVIIDFGHSSWEKDEAKNENTHYGGDERKARETLILFGKHIKAHGYKFS